MTLGEYLIQARRERGYSQRDLAAKSGISRAEISRLESGIRKKAAPAALRSLAAALDQDYNHLLQLAGYLEASREEASPQAALQDRDGKMHDLADCAREMYEKDKAWLQTAYQAHTELSDEDRRALNEMVQDFLEKKRGESSQT